MQRYRYYYFFNTREKISSLQIHDFAFNLRSNGKFTYAIVADKQDQDNNIRFVVDTQGNPKVLARKNWMSSIRLVYPESYSKQKKQEVMKLREKKMITWGMNNVNTEKDKDIDVEAKKDDKRPDKEI